MRRRGWLSDVRPPRRSTRRRRARLRVPRRPGQQLGQSGRAGPAAAQPTAVRDQHPHRRGQGECGPPGELRRRAVGGAGPMDGPATNLLRWAPAFLTVWRARRESCGSWRPTPAGRPLVPRCARRRAAAPGSGIGSARMQPCSSVATPRGWAAYLVALEHQEHPPVRMSRLRGDRGAADPHGRRCSPCGATRMHSRGGQPVRKRRSWISEAGERWPCAPPRSPHAV